MIIIYHFIDAGILASGVDDVEFGVVVDVDDFDIVLCGDFLVGHEPRDLGCRFSLDVDVEYEDLTGLQRHVLQVGAIDARFH